MGKSAKIFLDEDRGQKINNGHCVRKTFNDEFYFNMHKEAPETLLALNDHLLVGGFSMTMQINENEQVLILPVAGAISFLNDGGNVDTAAAGQVITLGNCLKNEIVISNPFLHQTVSFLEIRFISNYNNRIPTTINTYNDVNGHLNLFQELNSNVASIISVAKFNGRCETVYEKRNSSYQLFAFVIDGAFETEGCLLHQGDGLLLPDSINIETEALSNDALMLLIEIPPVSVEKEF